MSFYANFNVGVFSFPVLTCDYSFHQPTNSRGKVIASVRSGLIRVSVEVMHNHEFLTNWAAQTNNEQNGSITFTDIDQGSTFKTLRFSEAYCVSYREVFTPHGGVSSSFRVDLGITANQISVGGANHQSLW